MKDIGTNMDIAEDEVIVDGDSGLIRQAMVRSLIVMAPRFHDDELHVGHIDKYAEVLVADEYTSRFRLRAGLKVACQDDYGKQGDAAVLR